MLPDPIPEKYTARMLLRPPLQPIFINLRGRGAHFRAELMEKGVGQSRDYVTLLSFA